MKYKHLSKINFGFTSYCPFIKLFGRGGRRIPIEYMDYYSSNYDNYITRVNNGGTCRVIAIYYKGAYFCFNLPFAILFGDII